MTGLLLHIAQWESALRVGGQQFAQIDNYFIIWKYLFCQYLPKNTIILKSVKSAIIYLN